MSTQMSKALTRILSAFICLALLFCSLPQSIFAEASELIEDLSDNNAVENNAEFLETDEQHSPYVLGEIISERTATSKTFRMSDGICVVAGYESAVHFPAENGEWQDYDNTLVYSDAADAEDITGYATTKSDIQLKLANNSNSGNLLKITKDKYKISLSVPNANKSKALEIYPSEASVGDGVEAVAKLTKFASGAIYRDIFAGTDIEYIIAGSSVKEKQDSYTYVFELKLNGLVPVLSESGDILLKDETANETQLVIPAGVMIDADNNASEKVDYNISHENGKKYILTVTADAEWINADSRVFPVKIDPSVEAFQSMTSTFDTYISQASPDNNVFENATLVAGYINGNTNSEWHTLITPSTLPEIPKSAVVVDAKLILRHYLMGYTSVNIGVTEIVSSWDSSNVTWNTKPNYASDGEILDYLSLDASTVDADVSFDITRLAQKWYTDGNHLGVALIPIQGNGNGHVYFAASEVNTNGTMPRLMISYRDTKGIEGIWTYSSHSMGNAGTGHVNGFNGNLVFVHDDMSTQGNILPITVSHVFNTYQAANNTEFDTNMPVGKGWKLSVQETVNPITIDNEPWYVYNDADGTELYFCSGNGNTFVSEDGYGLTLSIGTTEIVMTDDYGNTKTFNKSTGYIDNIRDVYGNKKNFVYTSNRLTSITYTPTGQTSSTTQIRFTYNSAGALSRITNANDTSDYVEFYYSTTYNSTVSNSNSGYLRKILYSGGEYCEYTYDSYNSLKTARDGDTDYKITYTYTTYNGFERVSQISESAGGSTGQSAGFSYNDKKFTVRNSGLNDVYGNSDDISIVYLFDNFGRAICSYSIDQNGKVYGSSYAEYENNVTGYRTNNTIKADAVKGTTEENLMPDSGCESITGWNTSINATTYSAGLSTTEKFLGSSSLSLMLANNTGYVQLQKAVNIPEAGTYTLSAYIKTDTVVSASEGVSIWLDSTRSNYITGFTGTFTQNGWQRISVTKEFTSEGSTTVKLRLSKATGTVYFDNIQLERSESFSDYNFVHNSSVRAEETWVGDYDIATERGHSGKVVGSPSSQKEIYQSIALNAPINTTFMLSGWAKAKSVSVVNEGSAVGQRSFGLSVLFTYSSGDTELHYVSFNPENTDWQYASLALVPKATNTSLKIVSAKIAFVYDYNCNTAYFDDISLTIEPVQTYTYNDNGKITSITDIEGNSSVINYSNGIDPNWQTTPTNGRYDYTYNTVNGVNTHDIATIKRNAETSPQTLTYGYDSFGNVVSSKYESADITGAISSTAAYSSDGNFLESVTDYLGSTTDYSYNAVTKLLAYIEDANSNRTAYTYDSRGRVTTVYLDSDKDGVVDTSESSVSYLYTNNRLTDIDTTATAYTIAYDAFGNMISVSAGSNVLATYTYGANNGKLQSLTYGNGEYEEYIYDILDRLIKVKYNGSEESAFTIEYDSNGSVVSSVDGKAGRFYEYEYDSLKRLIRAYQYDADGNKLFSADNSFDAYGRPYRSKITVGSKSLSYQITYKADSDLVSKLTMPSSSTFSSIDYTYDSADRLTSKLTSISSTVQVEEAYQYHCYIKNSALRDTPLVSAISLESIDNDGTTVTDRYGYTYDEYGNITQIRENGTLIWCYDYDELGQLVREVDCVADSTRLYVYDSAGNITDKYYFDSFSEDLPLYHVYACLGAETSLLTFNYSSSEWGDLLTGLNGQTITYDEIGNPLNWRNVFSMTWEGRELKSFVVPSPRHTYTYTYNSDGVRVGKTLTTNSAIATYSYTVDGTRILSETYTGDYPHTLYFLYDESGSVIGVIYDNATYYYQKNLQGDIIRILSSTGKAVVEYTYNAWGRCLSTTGSMAYTLGEINPFRYRGYYYDNETGFYYLNSRYYDPYFGRFINADIYVSTGQGILGNNMFAYCRNNPVSRKDTFGMSDSVCVENFNEDDNPLNDLGNPTGKSGGASQSNGRGYSSSNTSVIDAAKDIYKTANSTSKIRTSTGTYKILFENLKIYVGKGGFQRAIDSAVRIFKDTGNKVVSIYWESSPNQVAAFMNEYVWQRESGFGQKDAEHKMYNKIWSPGKKLYEKYEEMK